MHRKKIRSNYKYTWENVTQIIQKNIKFVLSKIVYFSRA